MLNPATVLDPGHTTTNLSANQLIQFVRAVDLEVVLASYLLLQDLLVRSRGVAAVSSRWVSRRSLLLSFLGSIRGDSVDSQFQYSLPTVTGLTGLPVSESGFGFLPSPVQKPRTSQIVDVGEIIDPEDIPPAVLVQPEKLKKMQEQKKLPIHASCLKRVGQIQFLVVLVVKRVGYSRRRCCRVFHLPNCLRWDPKNLSSTVKGFSA